MASRKELKRRLRQLRKDAYDEELTTLCIRELAEIILELMEKLPREGDEAE